MNVVNEIALSQLTYIIIEHVCEAISFGLFCSFTRNCLSSTLDYIVMLMRKTNRKKGYLKLSHISLGEVSLFLSWKFINSFLKGCLKSSTQRWCGIRECWSNSVTIVLVLLDIKFGVVLTKRATAKRSIKGHGLILYWLEKLNWQIWASWIEISDRFTWITLIQVRSLIVGWSHNYNNQKISNAVKSLLKHHDLPNYWCVFFSQFSPFLSVATCSRNVTLCLCRNNV